MNRVEHLAEGVTLYLGDCREILPTIGNVDAIICDPPFGVDFKYESHKDDPEAYPALMREIVSLTEPLRGDGPSVFWQGMPNADRWHEWFPKGFRLFAACKGFVQYRPTAIQYSWDPIVFWGKSKASPSVERKDFHHQTMAPFGAGRQRIDHPCPRPIEQVRYVVETFTVDGELILDPFMGSGTTGVAAVNLGRKFIGIEIEPKYFDVACQRIADALTRPDLFVERPKSAEQEAMI